MAALRATKLREQLNTCFDEVRESVGLLIHSDNFLNLILSLPS